MTSEHAQTGFRVPKNVKAWLWVAVWTIAGAVIGTVIAYVLFGLVWTNWDVITGAQSAPAPKRTGGDPIDNWAKGVVAMMFAFPVVLAGFVAGTIAGFRLGHRRHHVKADHSAVCRLSEGRGDGDAFKDAMRSASHTSKNSGDAGGNSQ